MHWQPTGKQLFSSFSSVTHQPQALSALAVNGCSTACFICILNLISTVQEHAVALLVCPVLRLTVMAKRCYCTDSTRLVQAETLRPKTALFCRAQENPWTTEQSCTMSTTYVLCSSKLLYCMCTSATCVFKCHFLWLQELTARYGDYLSLSVAVPPKQAELAVKAIKQLVPAARVVHCLRGSLKLELPSPDVDVGQLFEYMDGIKRKKVLQVWDWGVSHATLEEVFIRITREAGVRLTAFN